MTPVGAAGSVTSIDTSTPSPARCRRIAVPKPSSPTRPMKAVACPSRARPTATLASAPPTCRSKVVASASGPASRATSAMSGSPSVTTSIAAATVVASRSPATSPRVLGQPEPGIVDDRPRPSWTMRLVGVASQAAPCLGHWTARWANAHRRQPGRRTSWSRWASSCRLGSWGPLPVETAAAEMAPCQDAGPADRWAVVPDEPLRLTAS